MTSTIDRSVIGKAQREVEVVVERGRLQLFARAIGEDNPVYTDVVAAREAGHPDLPVPPTFLFGAGLGGAADFEWLEDLGVDLRAVLHGEQRFNYHALAYAGDTLRISPRVIDVYSKKNGALQFLVRESTVHRDDGALVADLSETLVIRELVA